MKNLSGDGCFAEWPFVWKQPSLQRWQCETLIDHFNWKPFVLRATARLRANDIGNNENLCRTASAIKVLFN